MKKWNSLYYVLFIYLYFISNLIRLKKTNYLTTILGVWLRNTEFKFINIVLKIVYLFNNDFSSSWKTTLWVKAFNIFLSSILFVMLKVSTVK